MDNPQKKAILRTVVTRVLEDASFVFTDDLPAALNAGAAPDQVQGVSLSFAGASSGSFRLWGGAAFAALLSANMTGIDAAQPEAREKGIDAMKEILNIIAGNALTELFGSVAVFNLGIPANADPAQFAMDRTRSDGVWLMAEEHPLLCVADLAS
jgi:chemotaxis protein CheY-P-specific phosphatase CheC